MILAVGLFGITWLTGAFLETAAVVATAAFAGYSVISQRSAQKKSLKLEEAMGKAQLAAQQQYAGEYTQLTKREMELQSQQREIETLAGLIATRQGQQQVLTYPSSSAETENWMDKINRGIHEAIYG